MQKITQGQAIVKEKQRTHSIGRMWLCLKRAARTTSLKEMKVLACLSLAESLTYLDISPRVYQE